MVMWSSMDIVQFGQRDGCDDDDDGDDDDGDDVVDVLRDPHPPLLNQCLFCQTIKTLKTHSDRTTAGGTATIHGKKTLSNFFQVSVLGHY